MGRLPETFLPYPKRSHKLGAHPQRILGLPPQRVKGPCRTATVHHSPVRSLQMGGGITPLPHMSAWSAEGQVHKSTYTEIYSNKNPEC